MLVAIILRQLKIPIERFWFDNNYTAPSRCMVLVFISSLGCVAPLIYICACKAQSNVLERYISGAKTNLRFAADLGTRLVLVFSFSFFLEKPPGSSTEQFQCSDSKMEPRVIPRELVCNFVSDCSKGEDERDCGDCRFDRKACGWTFLIEHDQYDLSWASSRVGEIPGTPRLTSELSTTGD